MPTFFKVRDLQGFTGLVVEGELIELNENLGEYVAVERFHDPNSIMGDRILSNWVSKGILISREYIDECEDPRTRQFDDKNPWGKCQFEKSYTKGTLKIACAQFEKCFQVTIIENIGNGDKTIYSDYFFDDEGIFGGIETLIEDCLKEDREEDLVFELNDLKECF